MTPTDPAQSRYFILMGLRILATVTIVAGLILAFGDRRWMQPETQVGLGYGLMLVGFFDLLVILPFAIRRWRTPDDGGR